MHSPIQCLDAHAGDKNANKHKTNQYQFTALITTAILNFQGNLHNNTGRCCN